MRDFNHTVRGTLRSRLVLRLQVSAPITDDLDTGLLPTPTASDYRGGGERSTIPEDRGTTTGIIVIKFLGRSTQTQN